jgi:hypothetical protein
MSVKLASLIEKGIGLNENYSEVSRSGRKHLPMYFQCSEYFAREYALLLCF